MAQTPEQPQASTQEHAEQPQTVAEEPDQQDALLKLYNQLLPLSRGLTAQARQDPKKFLTKLPRIISGTIVRGMVTLIEEVGARDQDHESRLQLLEGHPLLNLTAKFGDDPELPDPNDPAILYALLADVSMCLDVLAGLAQKVPELAENEVVKRIPTNRAVLDLMMQGVRYAMEQQAPTDSGDDDDVADDDESAEEKGSPQQSPPPSDTKSEAKTAETDTPETEAPAAASAEETKEEADGQADVQATPNEG